jgi:hypothetical protein
MMKHPNEGMLALYAGQDLGAFARWRVERHLAGCARCRREVAEFSELRQDVRALDVLPDMPWNLLASEMKANIHVGLEAGECIRNVAPHRAPLAGMRTAVACVSVAILLLAGFWLERPAPPLAVAESRGGISLQAVGYGIEVRNGDQAFVLKNRSAEEDVTYSAGAQGSIGARFVDSNTGYVTINTVYVQ